MMNNSVKLHPDFNIHFKTLGQTVQTRVTILSQPAYNENTPITMIEPGRTMIIGDILEDLKGLLTRFGKPALNDMTYTAGREGGGFSSRAIEALRDYAFAGESPAPRAKPGRRKHTD
jgi:hypothetical protein